MSDLAPAPDGGPLSLMVRCRPTPTSESGPRHPVEIGPDWSVAVPHDLEAERVAVAFGGYNSCLTLVDQTIPALRAAFPLLVRRGRTPVRRVKSRWRVEAAVHVAGCCAGREYATAGLAARHLRSPTHLARQNSVPAWQLATIMRAVARAAWGSWEGEPPRVRGVERKVRESGGVVELWQAGLHPEEIVEMAAWASRVPEPLPVAYYLGLAYGDIDPQWLREVVGHRPDGDTAAWLARLDSPHSVGTAEEWGAWLSYGLARADVQLAVESGVASADVLAVAVSTRWQVAAAARNLVDWVRVGCRPTPAHFAALADRGIDRSRPSRGAVDAACAEIAAFESSAAEPGRPAPDRTEVAVLLELVGSRPALLAAHRRGVRSFHDLEPARSERSA